MAFVFGQPFTHDRFFRAYYSFSWSPDDMTVSLNMMALWTNFAKYGYGHLTRKAVHSIWRCERVSECLCVCWGRGMNQVCMPPLFPFNQIPLIYRLHNNNQIDYTTTTKLPFPMNVLFVTERKTYTHSHAARAHTHQHTHTQTTEEITHTHALTNTRTY